MPKNRTLIETRKIIYAIDGVCFQSHVNMRKCYLPCGYFIEMLFSGKYTGKYSVKNKNLSLLVTFSSFDILLVTLLVEMITQCRYISQHIWFQNF